MLIPDKFIKQHCLIAEPDDIIKGAVEGHVRLFTQDKLQHVDVNECKYPGGLGLIHLAAHYGQLGVVRLLIAAGADVDLQGSGLINVKKLLLSPKDIELQVQGFTALHKATSKGYLDMVQLLLDAGADINKPNGYGMCPLYLAIVNGWCDLVEMLLLRGAIYSTTKTHLASHPLHLAAKMGHTSIIQLFLDRGYAIDTKNRSDDTALSVAACENVQTSVDFLIKHGADVNLTSIEDNPHPEIIRVLVQAGANVHGQQGNEAPLHNAILQGDISTVKVLVDAGARMDVPDCRSGYLPLTTAILSKSTEMVEYLLMQNHDPNEISKLDYGTGDRQTALSVAVTGQMSNVEIMSLLLEYGADVNLCTETGDNALLAAAYDGKDIAVELLLKAGANVNHANAYSSTPLHQAVSDGSIEKVKLLIEDGADVNAKDKDGLRPLHLSAMVGKEDIVKNLSSARASMDQVSIHGETALHLATDFDKLEIVKILMTMGARCDVRDHTGTVPLHLAAVRGLPHIAEYLILKNKCTINYSDVFGATALHLATFNGHETTVQILLDNGADKNLTYKGELPLHIAQRCGHYSLVKLFDGVNPVFDHQVSLDTFLESAINTTGIGKVDDTDPDVKIINETVESYMREVLARVANLDPRFTMEVFLCGSVSENCKVGMPNERDIMICLTCFNKSKAFEVVEDISVGPHYAKVKIIDDGIKSLWPEMMVEPANGYILPLTLKRILMDNIADVLLQDDFQPPSCIYSFLNGLPQDSVRQCVVNETRSGFKMTLYWWSGCYKGMEITVDIILAFPLEHSPTSLIKRVLSTDSTGPFCYLVPKSVDMLNKYLWRVSTSNIEKEEMLSVSEEARQSYIRAKVLLTQAGSLADTANGVFPVPSYYLKTSFFFELEKFPGNIEWQGLKHLERMVSIFERLARWLGHNEGVPSFFIDGGFILTDFQKDSSTKYMFHNVSNIVQFLLNHETKAIDICPRDLCHILDINVI